MKTNLTVAEQPAYTFLRGVLFQHLLGDLRSQLHRREIVAAPQALEREAAYATHHVQTAATTCIDRSIGGALIRSSIVAHMEQDQREYVRSVPLPP